MMSNLCRKIAFSKVNAKEKKEKKAMKKSSIKDTKNATCSTNVNSNNGSESSTQFIAVATPFNIALRPNQSNNNNINALKFIQKSKHENNNVNLLKFVQISSSSSASSSIRSTTISSSASQISELNSKLENLQINNKNTKTMYQQSVECKIKEQKENIEVVGSKIEIEHIGRFADEPEYDMTHVRRGTAIIINNKRFDAKLEMPSRDGTDKDACALEMALFKLGFEVKTAHNCTSLFMRELLFRQARQDHSNADCFLCVIMTHGENGVVYGSDGEVELDQLIHPFKFNRTLAGKPKLFFIQACRGSNLMEGIDSNPTQTNYVTKVPIEADFLIVYSTCAGYYSWRNSLNGSWFIQSLCQVLNEHGQQFELIKLLTNVNRRVAFYYESNTNDPTMNGKKQVPSIVSMLTKEVYFRPKGDNQAKCSFQMSYA